MSKFYTYCYLDENNKPYYIGKGTGRRAYKVHDNVSVPPKNRIIILKSNLSEEDAYRHETYLIYILGRKSFGGLLLNVSDGGGDPPCWTGKKHKEISKQKISAAVSGNKHPQYGKPLTEEHKNKIKETKKKNPQNFSLESRLKMSLSQKESWARKKLERHGES
jgi:hypothetical protein